MIQAVEQSYLVVYHVKSYPRRYIAPIRFIGLYCVKIVA